MDRVDSFRVSEADLAKWEKKCKLLKSTDASSSEGSCRPLLGPSNEMRYIRYLIQNSLEFQRLALSYTMLPLFYLRRHILAQIYGT